MKAIFFLIYFVVWLTPAVVPAQSIRPFDDSTIQTDSLQHRIQYLMKEANVSGVALAVFNQNKPVFGQIFGLADVPQQKPLVASSVLYVHSFYETLSQQRVFKPLGMRNTSQIWQSRFDSAVAYGHNAEGKPYELMYWKEASAGGSMSTTLADYDQQRQW